MRSLKPNIHSVTAFAPATVANVAVGFDILGFALAEPGDRVTLTRRDDHHIVITAISAADELPTVIEKNTATACIKQLCIDKKITQGFSVLIEKQIPLSSGMGGSAASAVAALVACNAFLQEPITLPELVRYALVGEAVASGQPHGDNIVPAIYGGLTLVRSLHPVDVICLPIPDVYCVLLHPHLKVNTKDARGVLQTQVELCDHVQQSAQLASFVAALYQNDLNLLKRSLVDMIIEPQRAHLVPMFYQMQEAALAHGAFNASFSGSGPSLFAFAQHHSDAENIAAAMRDCLMQEDIQSDIFIARIATTGAQVETIVEG